MDLSIYDNKHLEPLPGLALCCAVAETSIGCGDHSRMPSAMLQVAPLRVAFTRQGVQLGFVTRLE